MFRLYVHLYRVVALLNIKQDTWTGSCTNTGTSNIAIELLSGNTVVQTASFTVNCGVEKTINPNFKLSEILK